MRVRYASRIVTRVFTLLVLTASLTTNARVSASSSGVFQESSGTLNDQPSSPRLLALRDLLTSGDRTALDKFWNEINEQGAPIIEPAAESDHDMLVTMLWRASEETKNVFVFRLGDVSKPMVRLLDNDLWYKTFRLQKGARFIYQVPGLTLCQTVSSQTTAQEVAAQEVLKTEREQREAFLQRDIAKTERLVADEFILTKGRDIGNKKTLIGFMRSSELDPTLTLTAEDTRVTINGDTAIVIGRRVERRRREDNNREGVAYARYVRTYVKRQEHWQLLAEHLETIPGERTAVKIDTKVYDDYVGHYESAIFDFEVVKDGERLMAVPRERTTTRTSEGRPRAELFPESDAEFFLKGRDAQVIFMRNRKGEVTHAIMRINGADIRAMRVK